MSLSKPLPSTGFTWTFAPKATGFRRLYAAIVREMELRRSLREIRALDDRTLLDIGINLGGAEDAIRRGRRR